MTIRFALAAITVFLTASSVRAEECPNDIPEDSGVRRVQAKKWFSKGQTAASEGDDVAALKAYQCSLRFVPHGFTAFNIAQIAERIGDLEVAIASYSQYMLLVPDAKDAQEVGEKLNALKERLLKVRQKEREITAAPPVATEPPPAQGGANAAEGEGTGETATAPVAAETNSKPAESITEEKPAATNYRTAAWIVYGGAGVALVAGVVTNILARGKMDTCRTKYLQLQQSAAESACSDAKPLAYMSYGLIGAGAAAAVVGTILVLRPTPSSEVAMTPLPGGGLAFGWSGRY
jgi:tetratricopeptide (TPR) repeat protein